MIDLAANPRVQSILKDIEREQFRKMMNYFYIGQEEMTNRLKNVYTKTMERTYSIYGQPLITPRVELTDTYITNNILKIPWCDDGKVYSQRLYGHVANFQSKLAYVLEEGIKNGKGMDWMMDSWRKLTQSTAYNTARLLRTETMAMWSQSTKRSLLSMGVKYVRIVGSARCGKICLDYVGEAIPLAEARIGKKLPPYHPSCACSFVEYTEQIG